MEIDGITILVIVWVIIVVFIFIAFYKMGRKALAIFPDIDSVIVKYRDYSASGYSTKSMITKIGGASKVLDIVVTKDEVWLKSMILFAGICQYYDLLHKIPFNQITNAKKDGKKVILDFQSGEGEGKQVILLTHSPDNFLKEIKQP